MAHEFTDLWLFYFKQASEMGLWVPYPEEVDDFTDLMCPYVD